MVFGDAAAVEHELVSVGGVPTHLAVRRLHDETERARVDDDVRDLVRRGTRGDRHALRHRGTGVGDEGLLPVDDPLAGRVVERRPRPRGPRVGTGLRLGEPERAEHLTGDHRDEVLLLLRLRPAVEERGRAQAHTGFEGDRHRRVDPCDLLDRDAVREEVGAAPPVFLGEGQPEQAELAHRPHGVDGKGVVAVPGLGVGCDLSFGEVAHDGTELLLFGRRVELHGDDGSRSGTVRLVDVDVKAREGYAVVRDGEQWVICGHPARVVTARGAEVFAALDEIEAGGFWVGFIAYDAGRAIEHIEPRLDDDLGLPDLAFVRFDDVRHVDELPPAIPMLRTRHRSSSGAAHRTCHRGSTPPSSRRFTSCSRPASATR